MSNDNNSRISFFRRLAKDTTANTIAISAASLVPLMAMVGGGVDASRYYMAETRLQAACDAGALAARRAMDDDSFTNEHKTIGLNFFDQNYEDGLFGTENLQRNYVATDDGEVNGSASGKIPTSIMGAFGYEEFNLKVDCTADINISNTDIMFVLDVTGSMGGTRIQGLRDAVMTFYDTVDESTSDSAQVRYGVVPYSMNVNVGQAIVDANPLWMAQSHEYQSRVSEGVFSPWEQQTVNYSRTGDATNTRSEPQINNQTYHDNFSQCVAHYNDFQTNEDFVSSNEAGWTQVSESGDDYSRTVVYNGSATYDTYTGAGGYYYGSGLCDVNFNVTRFDAESTITVTETREVVWEWVYKGDVTHNLAGLYDDNQVDVQTGWANTWETVSWDGCIEEANTVPNTVFDPVPTGAYDLDINLVPSNDDERWKPSLNGITYDREDSSGNWTRSEVRTGDPDDDFDNPYYTCPTAAFRLTDISRGNMQNYVNSLAASGNTYHDIGMIWGARFISPNGIFKSANETAPNGDAISRHIVFMTDGELQPYNYGYTTYGMEWWDQRISGDGDDWTQTTNNHAERFQAACRAARQENMSVWVVAFGTTLTQNLIDCATPGRAFAATNSAELEERFKEIAQQIAALRLTQ